MFKHLVLILSLLIAFTSCGEKHKYVPLPPTPRVVVLGDSLTYGTGAGSGEDYASLLARDTGWNVVNAGVPGNTSSDGLARLPELLNEHQSGEQKIDFLIIELGGNDFLKRIPEEETARNLKAILTQAKANNIPAVMLAIPQFSPIGAAFGNLSDHPLYEKLAQETGTPLIEDLFSNVLAKNNLKADQIHPNAEGYRIVANSLRDALVDLGFLREK